MRLVLVPMNPTVGDVEGNARQIVEAIESARRAEADLVVLPELCICGYPPRDLLLQEGFVAACVSVAKRVGEGHTSGITAIFGVPLPVDSERVDGPVANGLVAYRDGKLVGWYDKRLLPTYDVFDEDRYFTPGARAEVVEVAVRGGGIVRVGLSICEDLWRGDDAGFSSHYRDAPDPVEELVRAGAQVIVSPSASPFVLGKHEKHRMICTEHAKKHGRWVASVNQGGANDELVFDGHAMVFEPGGDLAACTALFGGEALMLDVDVKGRGVASVRGGGTGATRACDEHLLFLALTTGIRDYLRKCGFKSALLGLSGGIDSALTAALAVAAIGKENVLGVAMPSRYSSGHSVEDAHVLAKNLGMRCVTAPIEESVGGFRRVLDPLFTSEGLSTLGATLPDLTEENLQSRARGTILMAISNRTGSIVLTTGNKSELAVGYCTLYGDMNGGLAVLSDVSKHWVYALSRWMNANASVCGFAVPPIPTRSIEKAPSAELRPDQTDQDSLPAYPVLDEILRRYVEGRQSAGRIARETGYDEGMVRKIVRMIDRSEYKRKQAAIGLKVTTVAFGSGRRWPIAQAWR
jgi:NAD+ synthetase